MTMEFKDIGECVPGLCLQTVLPFPPHSHWSHSLLELTSGFASSLYIDEHSAKGSVGPDSRGICFHNKINHAFKFSLKPA